MYLLIIISMKYGTGKGALFMFGVVALALAMVMVAYSVGHDVWSSLNSFVVWLLALYFVAKSGQIPTKT
jgi:hypothetical protein